MKIDETLCLFYSQGPKGQKGMPGEPIFANIYLVCFDFDLTSSPTCLNTNFLCKYLALWKNNTLEILYVRFDFAVCIMVSEFQNGPLILGVRTSPERRLLRLLIDVMLTHKASSLYWCSSDRTLDQ